MTFITLVLNDLKNRNKVTFILLFVMPLVMIALMSYAMRPVFESGKHSPPVLLLYSNEDKGTAGIALDQFLSEQKTFNLARVNAQRLRTELAGGKFTVAVKVPADFSAKLNRGKQADIEVIQSGGDQQQEEITKSLIESFVSTYNTETGIAHALQTANNSAGKSVSPPQQAGGQNFVRLTEIGLTAKLSSYQYFAASMLVFFLLTTGMGIGVTLINERQEIIFQRILAFPVTRIQYLLSKVASNIILAGLQAATIILFTHFAFKVDWGTSLPGLILTIGSVVAVSAAIGIVFSNLVNSTKALTTALTLLFWFMTFISGGFTGKSMLARAGDFTVNKWAFTALANVMLGKGTGEIIGFLIPLFVAALVLWLIGIITYHRRVAYE
ncbi:MAG TPA: ABC transporter permease [Desulfobacteria bacterium]|nr:ABC transporter permease [Desulfobacteria bacterium]